MVHQSGCQLAKTLRNASSDEERKANAPMKVSCYCGKTRKQQPNFGIHVLKGSDNRYLRFVALLSSFLK